MSHDHTQNVLKLCRALKNKKILSLPELTKDDANLGDPAVLAEALNLDLIQIGRTGYSRTIVPDGSRIAKGKDGKPARDEMGRQVMEHEYKYHPDNEWSWMTAKNSAYRAPLHEVLSEDDPHAPPYHVRLTNAGLAASSSGKLPAMTAAGAA